MKAILRMFKVLVLLVGFVISPTPMSEKANYIKHHKDADDIWLIEKTSTNTYEIIA